MNPPKRPKITSTYTLEVRPASSKAIIIFTLFMVVVVLLMSSLMIEVIKVQHENAAIERACVEQGFPNVIEVDKTIFCHRLNNGSDEIIPFDWGKASNE